MRILIALMIILITLNTGCISVEKNEEKKNQNNNCEILDEELREALCE